MEREIENVLSHGKEDEILSSAFKLQITRGDIQTLRNQQWLNDVVKLSIISNLLSSRILKVEVQLLGCSTFCHVPGLLRNLIC